MSQQSFSFNSLPPHCQQQASQHQAPPQSQPPANNHNGHVTLAGIQSEFFSILQAGEATHCPVCNRYAKYELRPLNKTMAWSLIWIAIQFERNGGDWVNVQRDAPAWVLRTKQHTTLTKWGLLERQPNPNDSTKKHSGIWRPTALGLQFVSNQVTVPRKVMLWDDSKIGESEERITIGDALNSPGFIYWQVVQSPDSEIAALIQAGLGQSPPQSPTESPENPPDSQNLSP